MEGGVPKMSHGRKKSNRFMGEVQESVFIYRLGGGRRILRENIVFRVNKGGISRR